MKVCGKTVVVVGLLCNNPVEKNGLVKFTLCNKCVNDGDEKTEFERICVSGNQAKIVMKHLKRGSLCCVEGESAALNKKVSIHAQKITFLCNESLKEQ